MDKMSTIQELRDIFDMMCNARRRLRPILSEISHAIDNNIFIDANAEEVQNILDDILELQEKLEGTNELRQSINTRKLASVDDAINEMNRKQLIHELKDVLSKFKTLICDSEDKNELNAVKDIQKQAKKLSLKAEKMNLEQFKTEGNKFIDVAKKIEDPSTFSANSYLEIQRNFPDNPLLVYMLMKQSLHFEGSSGNKLVKTEQKNIKPKPNKRIEKINKYVDKYGVFLTSLFIEENNIEQIAKPVKKKMTVKSLTNKLREFYDGRESISNPILNNLCKSRIYSREVIFQEGHDEKTHDLTFTIVEKLYGWGIFTKVEWHNLTFYYLTDSGYELLAKILSIKDSKSSAKNMGESSTIGIAKSLRRFILFSTIWSMKIKKIGKNKIDGDMERFWIRSMSQINKNTYQLVFAFSLLLLDEDWAKHINHFIEDYEEAIKLDIDVKGVFLVSTLESKQMDSWVKLFKALGVKNIYKYLIADDGHFEVIDEAGHNLTADEWLDAVDFGKVSEKAKPKALPYDEDEIFDDIIKDLDEDSAEETQKSEAAEEKVKLKRITKTRKTKAATEEIENNLPKKRTTKKATKKTNSKEIQLKLDDVEPAEPKKTPIAEKKSKKKTAPQQNFQPDVLTNTVDSEPVIDEDTKINSIVYEDGKASKFSESEPDSSQLYDGIKILENTDYNGDVDEKLTTEAEKKFFYNLTGENKLTQEVLKTATNFFINGHLNRGMLSLHLLMMKQSSKDANWADSLCLEVGYILDDPMAFNQLRNIDTFNFWDNYYTVPNIESNELYDYLNLASIIKSFFAPNEPMSFQLNRRWNQINEDRSNVALKAYPSTKKLINLFKTFTDNTKASFASCLNVDHTNAETELTKAIETIKTMQDRIDAESRKLIKHPRTKGLVKYLYDTNGEVRKLLNIEGGSVTLDMIIDFCSQFIDDSVMDTNFFDNQSAAIVTEDFFSSKEITEYLDSNWEKIKVDAHKNEKFTGIGRDHQRSLFTQILIAMLKYAFAKKRVDAIKKSGQHSAPTAKALEILSDIETEFKTKIIAENKKILRNVPMETPAIKILNKVFNEYDNANLVVNFLGVTIFITFIEILTKKINGEEMPPLYSECLWGTKYLEMTKEFLPITESYDVEAFSFANRVIEFEQGISDMTAKEAVNLSYETAVRGCDLGVLTMLEENFRQMIDRSDEELKKRRENVSKLVDRQLDRIYHEFLDNLELDRNYDRITNQEAIDKYINVAAKAKVHFTETKNAGIYQRFINACNEEIAQAALPHKTAMEQRLSILEEKLESELDANESLNEKYPIVEEIHKQLDLGNLTVAEDYMNRWNAEGENFTTLDVIDIQNEPFDTFLADYEMIFNACIKNKSESLEKIYTRMRGSSVKNRSARDATDFVTAWQGLNTDTKARAEKSVIDILNHLSFTSAVVDSSEKIPPNQWKIHVSFPNYRRSKAAYPHSFAVYGTETAKKGLTIIYLASNRTADNIVETLAASVKSDCGVICFVDFALSLAERRKLAQAFKIRYDLKDIIVIDRVMAIYLTRFEDSVRGLKMLKTALPFARVQPYTTGGVVAPEMFIGRSKELAKIRDMTGPVFVYGGRQLGKSALLRQVRNIENDPENGSFAFFIELKSLDSDKALEKIVRELKEAGLINRNEEIISWDDFSFVMKDLLSGKSERYKVVAEGKTPKKLILLLDESDEFLASVENLANRAIDVLRELFETFSGKFKFVLAGLHKVIRFEKNLAFGNLDHISILPFTPTDALELLMKPMSSLGFIIKDEGLTSAIFSRANYYPGLIQYYCKMIVDAAGDNYTQRNFDVTKNPPYKLDNEYLKNMLGKRDFQDEINKKFQITLKLDDDNFYEIIALVIAMEYYAKNCPVHVSVSKIKETCFIYDINKIANMSDTNLENLMEEMVELNLLRKVDDQYEFNRYAFWHMLGTESEIENQLINYGAKD